MGLTAAEKSLPDVILIAGITVSLLLSFSLYLLINSRKRAINLADGMTSQLRESEKKYRLIFENLQDVYYRTDNQGKILDITPSIEKYISLKPEEIIGRNAAEFYMDPSEREKLLQAISVSGTVNDYPLSLKDKNNQPIETSLNAHLKYDEQKKPIGLEGVLRDVRERKKYEQQLQMRTSEAERLNKITLDRELKMMELKAKIKFLEAEKLKNA